MPKPSIALDATTQFDALIEEAIRLRDDSAALEAERKEIDKVRKVLNYYIIERMQEEGIQRTGTSIANVSISMKQHATVEDWDVVYQYIRDNDAFHLLHKRLSSTSAVEILEMDGEMPGVEFYEEAALNLRKR